MADTVRTLAELNILLADNANNDISPQDIRDLMVSFNLCYGEIGVVDNASGLVMDNTFMDCGLNTAGKARGVSVSGQRLVAPVDGVYDIKYRVNFNSLLSTSGTYEFAVFKNPDTSPTKIDPLDFRGDQNIQGAIHPGYKAELNANDSIALLIKGPNTASVTIRDGMLSMDRKE